MTAAESAAHVARLRARRILREATDPVRELTLLAEAARAEAERSPGLRAELTAQAEVYVEALREAARRER